MNQKLNDISEEVLKDDERLMQFLRGELSAEDETAFMQKLQQNPDLKSRAVAIARLIKGLERHGINKDEQLKSAFKKLSVYEVKQLSKPSGKVIGIKKIAAWVLSVAAVLVLVLGLRIFYVNNSNEKLAAEYENTFQFLDFSRGGDDDLDSKLQNWIDNVLQGRNLYLTIEKLSEIFAQSQSETFNVCTNYFAVSGWYLRSRISKITTAKRQKKC